MLTKNFDKIIASAIMTNSVVKIDATNFDGNVSNNFLGNAASGAGNGFIISALMQTVRKDDIKNSNGYGVWFGDGETPPTRDDYRWAGTIAKNFTHQVSVSSTADAIGISTTAVYTITNNNSTEITIREICMFSRWYRATTSDYHGYLIDRTVLDTPVTIPAGGIGQVTYTIRMNYPTA